MEGYMIVVIVGMAFAFAILKLIVNTVLEIVRPKAASWDKNGNIQVPPMFDKMLAKAMAERDEQIRTMEERIQVLEQIVTDGHKRDTLAEEIESLRR